MEAAGSIIQDLAVVVVCAAVVTVIFKFLRLPLLLGYLLSGLLVGPNLFEQSPVKNLHTIHDLSELGVAFLMFYIGLEFDLKKLQRMFGSAILAVTLQTAAMIFLGLFTASVIGWATMDGLFLGCLLAISSTMITIPILRSQDALKSNFGQTAIGILILEDILAILILVVLSGVGLKGTFDLKDAWQTVFLVGVFVVMVFFLGKLLAPLLLRALKRFGEAEMITVVAVAALLGIGELADHFNFSIALGAFLAGSILSQNELATEIEHAIEPLRNLFTAVFFVTVGMLIEPLVLLQYWKSITVLTLLVVFGKTLTTWLGLYLTGERPSTAFKAALCKAQIGEFSFVIAALGINYKLIDPGLSTIAVGVALGTIIIVPPLSGTAIPIFDKLAKILPRGLKDAGEFYSNFLSGVKSQIGKSAFLTLVKRPMMHILMYFMLFNGVIIGAFLFVNYVHENPSFVDSEVWIVNATWVGAAVCSLPFLIAIIKNLEVILLLITETAFSLKASRVFKRGRMRNVLNNGLLGITVLFFSGIYLSAAASYLPSGVALGVFLLLVVMMAFFFWRDIAKVNSRLEHLFLKSFSYEVESLQDSKRDIALKNFAKKHPWSINLYDVALEAGSIACGKRIADLELRQQTGVTIVGVGRGKETVYDPGPDAPLFAGDHLILIGSEEENKKAQALLGQKSDIAEKQVDGDFEIGQVYLDASSPITGLTLADAKIRPNYRLTVVGIQRGEKKVLSPGPDEILKSGDILVVVGNRSAIEGFRVEIEG